ncbi:hypothetical protein NA57DRAFT_76542 [Rhizodiscina lignyota]|uniref:GST N-terminal domain-containing protein n=1 Tax=Rhizodiscina lignyota TaxID=1504668 RepID=A0A9P4IEA4_9PEZI|nr:hypothetical protein NA57DRAFT_76542 [Rhizodiscina lignyota]
MNGSAPNPPVVLFDYVVSKTASKIRSYLAATSIPYTRVELPISIPREVLISVGITHRRVPILAIGKDVYCDSAHILDALQASYPEHALPTSRADEAYKAWGMLTSQGAVPLTPIGTFPKDIQDDRKKLFPMLGRKDYQALTPSTIAECKAALDVLEKDFLPDDQPFIGGDKLSMADAHVEWAARWPIEYLDHVRAPGFRKTDYPRISAWLDKFPEPKPTSNVVSGEEAIAAITCAECISADYGFDDNDPLQLYKGALVSVESKDDFTGENLQVGRLEGLSRIEVVIELESGIRMHFPRVGYVVKQFE